MSEIPERKYAGVTVRIDRDMCMASGNCMNLGPDFFEFDDERICTFIDGEPAISRERIIEACRVCPVDALIVIDEDGRQIVP